MAIDRSLMAIHDGSQAAAALAPQMNKPLIAVDHHQDGRYHLLLAASGSVATIKIPNIVKALGNVPDLSIRIILTGPASHFLQGQSHEQPSLSEIATYPNVDGIYQDSDEWIKPWTRGDPILHIELRRWADAMFIAPLSANTLGKIANGLCDDLLTSVTRAWQVEEPDRTIDRQKYITVAPAMNTAMWRHPLSKAHIASLPHWFRVLDPIQKTIACGDTGDGAMCEWSNIVKSIRTHMSTQGMVRHLASY